MHLLPMKRRFHCKLQGRTSYFKIAFTTRSSIAGNNKSLESLSAHLLFSLGMVGIKGCVTSLSSEGHYPPLGFNSKLNEMHLMTIPKFELGIIASRSTPHPCLKQYSSKPLGKMFTCNLKAFANVLEFTTTYCAFLRKAK
jgi:hypothetical protein